MIENILSYSIGSLAWGLLIALSCISLFLFLIKGWYKDAYFKPVSYIIAGVLCLILVYNCTIICGAIAIKSDIETFKTLINQVIETSFSNYNDVVDEETSNDIIQQIIKEHPILNYYVGYGNFEGWKLSELPNIMADTLKSYLNNIILKKLIWSIVFVVIGAVLAIKTIGRSGNNSRRRASESRYGAERVSARSRRPITRRR